MPKPKIVAATALGIALALACTSPEERAESAREAVRQAVAQGDRAAALDVLDDLRAAAPDTPEALLELAQLLVHVGSAPDAATLPTTWRCRSPGGYGLNGFRPRATPVWG